MSECSYSGQITCSQLIQVVRGVYLHTGHQITRP